MVSTVCSTWRTLEPERAEHTHIIITSVQKVDSVIPNYDHPLSSIWVRVIKNGGNISKYHTRVFHFRSGPNQYYYTEYYWEHISPSSTRKVKGRTLESE